MGPWERGCGSVHTDVTDAKETLSVGSFFSVPSDQKPRSSLELVISFVSCFTHLYCLKN